MPEKETKIHALGTEFDMKFLPKSGELWVILCDLPSIPGERLKLYSPNQPYQDGDFVIFTDCFDPEYKEQALNRHLVAGYAQLRKSKDDGEEDDILGHPVASHNA